MAKIDPRTTDLWQVSRAKTAGYRGVAWERLLRTVMTSLPGRPTKMSVLGWTFGTENTVQWVDLNVYRPNCPVEQLIDLGIDGFYLRVTHPTRWEFANMGWKIDSTFPTYYERIRKKSSTVWVGGYHVHSHWEAEQNYELVSWQADYFREATKNHPLDLYALDDEVGEIWKDGHNTVISNVNAVRSVSNEMRRFMGLRKWPNGLPVMALHYSALWYMKKYGSSKTYVPGGINVSDMAYYRDWLDRANADRNNMQAPPWRAYVPTQLTQTYNTVADLQAAIITPTGTQENLYLNGCTGGLPVLWQCLFTAKWPGMDTGVDFSLSYGDASLKSNFIRLLNLPTGVTPPPTPPPPSEYLTRAEYLQDRAADAARLAEIKALL